MKRFYNLYAVFILLLSSCTQSINFSYVPERGFYSTRAAQKWEESLVTGNGTMGAMVAGNPFHEKIVFNHALLYLPLYPTLKPVSQGDHLEEIRQLTLEWKYAEASQLVVDLLAPASVTVDTYAARSPQRFLTANRCVQPN